LKAAREVNLDKVISLILKGADINTDYYLGWTPLHLASEEGHYDVVEYLKVKGVE